MAGRVMRLVDAHTGRMKCKVCCGTHYALIKPRSGGRSAAARGSAGMDAS